MVRTVYEVISGVLNYLSVDLIDMLFNKITQT